MQPCRHQQGWLQEEDVRYQACPEAAHLFDNLTLAISAQARGD